MIFSLSPTAGLDSGHASDINVLNQRLFIIVIAIIFVYHKVLIRTFHIIFLSTQ